MILSDTKIYQKYKDLEIYIEPFDSSRVNPTSYDVILEEIGGIYIPFNICTKILDILNSIFGFSVMYWWLLFFQRFITLSTRKESKFYKFIIPKKGMIIYPRFFYLLSTVERVGSKLYSSEIKAKSSIARLSIFIHFVASWIDVGFYGKVTLEVTSIIKVRVYPHDPIGQMIYHVIDGKVDKLYNEKNNSKYMHQDGPIPSKMFKNFK